MTSPFYDRTPDPEDFFIGQRFRYICPFPDITGEYILTEPAEDHLALINLETGRSYKAQGFVHSEGSRITVAVWDQLADIYIWPAETDPPIWLDQDSPSDNGPSSVQSPNQLQLFA